MSAKAKAKALTLALWAAFAAPASAQSDDAAALAELMQTLEEETEVATRTRMNRDFVPGMVTVLEGAVLRDLGARTVWEALSHAPGLQTEIDARGVPTLTARGIYFPFNSGSIQILLNGLAIGREDIGANGSALILPMTLVERIEFVRGPGSVIYGDYAFQGMINIVTRSGVREIVAGIDNHGGRTLDALHHAELGEIKLSSALGWRNSSEAVLPVGFLAREQSRSLVLRAAPDVAQLARGVDFEIETAIDAAIAIQLEERRRAIALRMLRFEHMLFGWPPDQRGARRQATADVAIGVVTCA